jgi:aspartyl aminopeptidase
VVIKTNAKQRYASDAITSFMVKQLIERKGGSVQEYEVRNDMCVQVNENSNTGC